MKLLQQVLIIIAIVVALLALIGFMLPEKWSVSRAVSVDAPAAKIAPYLGNLKNWQEWSPWNSSVDPSISYTYFGPDSGVGASTSWTSNKLGAGSMVVKQVGPSGSVWYTLQFAGSELPAEGAILLAPLPSGTQVTWTSAGNLGNNPVNRYFGLLMNSLMGADFDTGLLKLKKIVESAP